MQRILLIVTLVIAGEMVFSLPFHTARFFRPTLLDVFSLSNTQLGDMFAVYGVLAMVSYFPGGALADRFSTRALLTISLFATGLGGLVMASLPGPVLMAALYGYFGVTSIFLFWGALIRATRDWGGDDAQGKAFGILEAGRGLVAAAAAGLMVAVLASMLPDNIQATTHAEQTAAMQRIIVLYSLLTMAAGVLTWLLVPRPGTTDGIRARPFAGVRYVLRRPVVWAQAAVIVCAYSAYKGLDNYSLYAVQVLGMDEVAAARFATWGAYLRPVGALLAGYIADRFAAAQTITVLFAALLLTYLLLGNLSPEASGQGLIVANLFVSYFAVYALRGVYFALLEECGTPVAVTGATVGLVSLVGFTPDIFFAPIAGRLLDANPGLVGHQHYFLFLAGTSLLGVLVVAGLLLLLRRDRRSRSGISAGNEAPKLPF